MRLRKLLHTYSFRITLLYVGLSGISVLILFGVVYWVTDSFMQDQLRSAIGTEASYSVAEFNAAGPSQIADEIGERVASPEHELSFYLLQDPAGRQRAGNLKARPVLVGWYILPIPPENGGEDSSDAFVAEGPVLSNGWGPLAGPDTGPFSGFAEGIPPSPRWGLGP